MTVRRYRVRQYAEAGCTEDETKARQKAAFAAINRLYRESAPLWRVCARGFCRRHRRCCGDADCLKRNWKQLPAPLGDAAFAEVRRGGPRRVPPVTRNEFLLRRYPPSNFVYK